MRQGILILLSATFITGCAERGYKVSTNNINHTTSAQYTIQLSSKMDTQTQKRGELLKSVKKVLDTSISKINRGKKPSKVIIEAPYIDLETQYQSPLQNIHFTRTDSIYQNFGNSEVHGHVIYLTPQGEETHLNNTHVYILSQTDNIRNWYTNTYLTNTTPESNLTFQYLNSTSLNLNKNFTFYGIPEGEYFILIVSTVDNNLNKNVYIAKKIHVDKRKKIMVVFSKKL